jgi:starch synthase (maltosyl-transferring)
MSAARDNIILVVVNLDPFQSHDSFIDVPVEEFGWLEGDTYQVHDLLSDERYLWHGRRNFVKLDPQTRPAHVLRLRRWVSREQNFDQFM